LTLNELIHQAIHHRQFPTVAPIKDDDPTYRPAIRQRDRFFPSNYPPELSSHTGHLQS
jgi:hypothetical protein